MRVNYIVTLIKQNNLILTLAYIDFKEQFAGSYLGVLWAVLRPLIFISVVWAIFSVGIKGAMINSDVPFVIYLLTGYVPWMFFSSALTGLMSSFTSNKNLVKRSSFKVGILPMVKILSSLMLHIIFLCILVVVMLMMGMYPSVYWLQLPFYIFMVSLFLFGFGVLLGSLRVFTKDVSQFIAAVLQVGFWVTPIFWSVDLVPEKYQWLLNFNPMVYIVNGYRNTFINKVWFWEDGSFLVSFSLFTVLFLGLGVLAFKKLKPHFGDVL